MGCLALLIAFLGIILFGSVYLLIDEVVKKIKDYRERRRSIDEPFGRAPRPPKPRGFYAGMRTQDISLYEKYIAEMLDSVDIDNLTDKRLNRDYDSERATNDLSKAQKIAEDAETDRLNSTYLVVIFMQYVFADPWRRERYKEEWVETVLRRSPTDFFPDPWAMAEMFQAE